MSAVNARVFIAPIEALHDPELTPAEFRMLCVLYSFRGKNTNTVWPGLDKIRELCGYTDNTQVSRMTTKLERKGWLTKNKKTGPRGTKKYDLTVPDRLDSAPESQVDSKCQVDFPEQENQQINDAHGQVDCRRQVDIPRQGQVDTHSQGQLDRGSQAAYEHTTEQTIEQTSSVACATAAVAASRVDNSLAALGKAYSSDNPGKAIFDLGVPWLATSGCHEQRARAVLGSLIKRFGQGRAFDALITAMMVTPADPPAYLLAVASKIGDQIPQDWVPPEACMAELAGYGVPQDIIEKARDIFVIWFREQGIRHPSFSGLFVNWCRKDWERAEGNRTAYLNRLAASAGLPQQQAWREPA